ncbi:MAG: lysozyme inhibitor LprI family protein [Desulfotalea sp.]
MKISYSILAIYFVFSAFVIQVPLAHADIEEDETVGYTEAEIIPAEKKDWHAFIGEADNVYSMNTRAKEAMHTLDERLDEIIAKENEKLDEKAAKLLQKNQSAWMAYIRTKCSYLADAYRGGSYAGPAYGECVAGEQVLRAKELQEMFKDRNSP